jgi:segregation and condensation protein A
MSAAPSPFQVRLEVFSGPLDLLCALVESEKLDVVQVRLSELMDQYVSFLLASERSSLAEAAEFFSLASRLVLGKVRALFPKEGGGGEEEVLPEDSEGDLAAALSRYRPYRAAAAWLSVRRAERGLCFVRESEEGPPAYEAGDLYALASHWWRLVEGRTRRSGSADGSEEWDPFPRAVPEEIQVERRMEEIEGILDRLGAVTLSGLLEGRDRSRLVTTLLALLEMSRLGRLRLIQADLWGEIALVRAA